MFGILADFCIIKCPKYEITRDNQLCRFFTKSWDKENDPNAYELPDFNGPQIPDPTKSCSSAVRTYFRRRFCLKRVKIENDMDLEDILKIVGEPTVLGLDQSVHIKK